MGLVVLLRKLGFETYPVALSTRSEGHLTLLNPTFDKLNYMVALAKVDNEFVLLDATDELLPYYLLPARCLNQHGRIIDKDTSDWVDLNPTKKHKRVASYNLQLESDMTLSGKLNYANYDYAAYEMRKKLEQNPDIDDFLESFGSTKSGLIINDAVIKNVDSIYLPVKETYDITLENVLIQSDSLIYLSMMPFERLESNPFNNEERLYPIDFVYPRERSGMINISLPPGVEVLETPEPLMLKMPNKSIDYVYSISQLGNKLVLNYRLRINNFVISMMDYPNLRNIYEQIIEKESEPVILKLTNLN
jgi:hypothetical protein|tara:strand:+ start:2165 stop:3079 length:915 start_codon:yes stop_codon:yes gene_type:complete